MHLSSPTGVMLINLGTPDSCRVSDVRKYLNEFLYDPRVVELPTWLRWLLVKCWIVPLRAKKSAAAYAKIWQPTGSPLLSNSLAIKEKLSAELGANYRVTLGMRYGNPSISAALQELQTAQVQTIKVLPMFPQYSSAATGSAVQQVLAKMSKLKHIPGIEIKTPYYNNTDFIQALANSIAPFLQQDYDYLLMSYHGLPEQQMLHQTRHACDLQAECPAINQQNINCYRAQCFHTSRLIAQRLNLKANWGVAFQSRLGKLPWIKPYADEELGKLIARGVRKLVVCCPSFVADCLETLEEIDIRARAQWFALGGTSFNLVPCLNATSEWVCSLATIFRDE